MPSIETRASRFIFDDGLIWHQKQGAGFVVLIRGGKPRKIAVPVIPVEEPEPVVPPSWEELVAGAPDGPPQEIVIQGVDRGAGRAVRIDDLLTTYLILLGFSRSAAHKPVGGRLTRSDRHRWDLWTEP